MAGQMFSRCLTRYSAEETGSGLPSSGGSYLTVETKLRMDFFREHARPEWLWGGPDWSNKGMKKGQTHRHAAENLRSGGL